MGYWYDEDECVWREKPKPLDYVPRRYNRSVLAEAVMEEIERGKISEANLYASLLAKALIEHKPVLRQKYGQRLKSLGVAVL